MVLSDETRDLISRVLESLPVLTAKDIPDDEDSCPICLTPFSSLFLDDDCGVTKLVAYIRPSSESDNESSDGGEYIPDEDFDDEDDGFMDTDGFSDAVGYTTDEMEYDGHEWGESDTRDTDMEDTEVAGADDGYFFYVYHLQMPPSI
ncbi:hypothetical protein C0993_004375 [Termitomyces sp. T159_Od127]|nr:hypothetical protein C0993_004375 [Termitomyces sp. T159_Od127]